MAMSSYTQKKASVLKALRQVRQRYRRADSLGEQLERELDRLILRKSLVGPDAILRVAQRFTAYATTVESIRQSVADAATIAAV